MENKISGFVWEITEIFQGNTCIIQGASIDLFCLHQDSSLSNFSEIRT